MVEFKIYSKECTSANILRVEVGTNCPQGGDSGHGGRSVLRFIDEASTDMSVGLDGNVPESAESVEIQLGGDTECDTLLQALEFAVEVLRAQLLLNHRGKATSVR